MLLKDNNSNGIKENKYRRKRGIFPSDNVKEMYG